MTPHEQGELARRRLAAIHNRRRGDLALVQPGRLVLPAETPQDHIRNALQLMTLAWTRVDELSLIDAPEIPELLRGAEARLFRALYEMEQTPMRCPDCGLPFGTTEELARHGQATGHGRTMESDLREDR